MNLDDLFTPEAAGTYYATGYKPEPQRSRAAHRSALRALDRALSGLSEWTEPDDCEDVGRAWAWLDRHIGGKHLDTRALADETVRARVAAISTAMDPYRTRAPYDVNPPRVPEYHVPRCADNAFIMHTISPNADPGCVCALTQALDNALGKR
jgi:hypothetical protein